MYLLFLAVLDIRVPPWPLFSLGRCGGKPGKDEWVLQPGSLTIPSHSHDGQTDSLFGTVRESLLMLYP
jgi:hypothetical protein